ncbi:hypothetical protein B0E53_06193 [Micromonospora sp. MH33]|nr:hypothetical protein B0E53_06193 [Micromonospora sp. MH33]
MAAGRAPRTGRGPGGGAAATRHGRDPPPVHVPATTPPAAVVDTNGAGDAFAAGLIAARLRGAAPLDAARYAARVAAAACSHDGMEYPAGLLPRG